MSKVAGVGKTAAKALGIGSLKLGGKLFKKSEGFVFRGLGSLLSGGMITSLVNSMKTLVIVAVAVFFLRLVVPTLGRYAPSSPAYLFGSMNLTVALLVFLGMFEFMSVDVSETPISDFVSGIGEHVRDRWEDYRMKKRLMEAERHAGEWELPEEFFGNPHGGHEEANPEGDNGRAEEHREDEPEKEEHKKEETGEPKEEQKEEGHEGGNPDAENGKEDKE